MRSIASVVVPGSRNRWRNGTTGDVLLVVVLQLSKAQVASVLGRQRIDAQGRAKIGTWADGRQADKGRLALGRQR